MKYKIILLMLLLITTVLTGCAVSASDSNIPYNRMYSNIEIESVSCGRDNHLTFVENKEKTTLSLSDIDCLFLIEHRKHLERLGENEDLKISFISDGYFIDGIMIDK